MNVEAIPVVEAATPSGGQHFKTRVESGGEGGAAGNSQTKIVAVSPQEEFTKKSFTVTQKVLREQR